VASLVLSFLSFFLKICRERRKPELFEISI